MTCRATPELLTCTACRLHATRTQVVPGHGNYDATIAAVGEAPGRQEDEHGGPFWWEAPAGAKLDYLLSRVGLSRAEVWLDNVVHCRPPDNDLRRFPDAQATCPELWLTPTLDGMPNLRVVVTLGATAGVLWFPGKRAGEMATLARSIGRYVVVGAYHPAFASREGEWVDESILKSLRRAVTYANL